jgi:hypothetical protein
MHAQGLDGVGIVAELLDAAGEGTQRLAHSGVVLYAVIITVLCAL